MIIDNTWVSAGSSLDKANIKTGTVSNHKTQHPIKIDRKQETAKIFVRIDNGLYKYIEYYF
jgi:hypothetical protein